MTTSSSRFRPWRRAAELLQAALFLGIPFVKVGGESALRFDIPTLRLLFFGHSVYIEEFFVLLTIIVFLFFAFLGLTIMFGRIWCGWLCPQTVLSDLTGFVDRSRSAAARALSYLAVLAASALVATDITWYFVEPARFIDTLKSSGFMQASFALLAIVIFVDIAFVRRVFCATVCPYSRLQSVLFDSRTMAIAYDASLAHECMGCSACQRACPVGIDIRDGVNYSCISCAECVDACAMMRGRKGKGSLVGYFFGGGAPMHGARPSLLAGPLRLNLIIVSLVSIIALAGFIYLASSMQPLGLTIRSAYDYPPRLTFDADGGLVAVNAYDLSIRNLHGKPIEARLSSADGQIVVSSNTHLTPGEVKLVRIYLKIKLSVSDPAPSTRKVGITIRDGASGWAMPMELSFRIPASDMEAR